MKSLGELYRIGRGPSSSHTMGPEAAARYFINETAEADDYKVILYGSLARTGKGHGTDLVLEKTFLPKSVMVVFDKTTAVPHPNTMDIIAFQNGAEIKSQRFFSVGGGAIEVEGTPSAEPPEVYPLNSFEEIKAYCTKKEIGLPEYVRECEGDEIFVFLKDVYDAMLAAIKGGLNASGVLPGVLKTERKAQFLFKQRHIDESPETRENRMVCSYAFAVSEQNAAGEVIVTAPTCGSSGIVPAVLRYLQLHKGFSEDEILNALATAGIIGNLIKTNASISGAECGCQAEVGSACSMAAAAAAELFNMDLDQIEYAAEVAMEHHLGLTCDPIEGLVQIPCIERNAVAAMRALNAVNLANFLTSTRKISFDTVVATMYETGKDMNKNYRETSEAGLAVTYFDPQRFKRNKTK